MDRWLDNDSKKVRSVGQALIARSYVMDGIPMDMPGHRYGIIALDASEEARQSRRAAQLARRLYETFDPLIDVTIVRMGQKQVLTKAGQPVSTSDLQPSHAQPRLLMCPLEDIDLSKSYFVLALTWGRILDSNDLDLSQWAKHLIVVSVGNKVEWPKNLEVISIDSPGSE
jgi:hypothetical protein